MNDQGSLGDNSNQSRRTPVKLAGATKTFCQIAARVAIDKYGRAWAWGDGDFGSLGNGNELVISFTPIRVYGNKTFCKIGANGATSIAIDKNGKAWGWGYNGGDYNLIGDGTQNNRSTPTAVAGNKTFCEISVRGHSLAIDKYGKAWGWGSNYNGRIGDNSTSDRLVPVSVYGSKTFCKIFAGGEFSLAIDKNGTTWSWGANTYGALGDNSITSRLTPVRVCNI